MSGARVPAEPSGSAKSVRVFPREAARLRPTLVFFALLVLLSGLLYPGTITEIARTTTPGTAHGSILHWPNGSAYGSSLLGENLTAPDLFWPRASLIDYLAFTGAGNEVPYGPTDPNLVNLTDYYIAVDGLNNTTVPLDLVGPSSSGLDPVATPAAVLIQVPRVAHFSGLTEAWLTDFVHRHVVAPILGFFGPSYVNVLALDVALLPYLPTAPLVPGT